MSEPSPSRLSAVFARLTRRGVFRVAFSYAVIAWLVLQIGDVVLDPFEFGNAVMRVLLVVVALGFPVALVLAWFLELTPEGIEVDHLPPDARRPLVTGVRRYADVIIICLLIVAIAFLVARQGGLIEEDTGQQVVAVLPFTNLGTETQDTNFGEGLADTLIQKLGELKDLVVLASQSTFQYRGQNLDIATVGAELGATAIMIGSVQRAGNSIRVNARLVSVSSGKQLWSASYDRRLEDVFAIQDELAVAATDALKLVLSPSTRDRLVTSATTNLTAYDAYVLGRNRLATRTPEGRQLAIAYFRDAIAQDPHYVLAYAGLVEALYLEGGRAGRTEQPREIFLEARDAAKRALELAPEQGEGWLARALVALLARDAMNDHALADDDIAALFEKAVELSPNNAMAYKWFAGFLATNLPASDRRALELMQKAAKLDPRSGIIKVNVGEGLVDQGKLDEAERWFWQAAQTREPYFDLGLVALVELHLKRTGRLDESARWTRVWRQPNPGNAMAASFQQDAFMNLGAWNSASKVVDELARMPPDKNDPVFDLAHWAALHGGMLLARANRDVEKEAKLAGEFAEQYWHTGDDARPMQTVGWQSYAMVSMAILDIDAGRAREALARFEQVYPGPFDRIDTEDNGLLRPVVMLGALYKQTGERGRAEKLLRDYLAFVRNPANAWRFSPHDWTEFTILALLGETDEALAELKRVVDSGYLYEWYQLRDGAFDPDYAVVIGDPRFETIWARINARVDKMRAEFFARPDVTADNSH